MDKSQMLVTGLGQCGGILADGMKVRNQRYTTMYINSSLGDTKGLKFADRDTNVFIYSGADGSGRNRDKAKKFIDNDKMRLATFLNRFKQFVSMIIFTSLDGGTGSGSVAEFIRLVKAINPTIKINVVGVLPKLKEQDLQLQNTIDCCSELAKISTFINDIKFINNNKREKSDYSEINKEAIEDIDMSYGMLGHSDEGSIDTGNLENVCTAQGYGVILRLPKHYNNLNEAINHAKNSSLFAMPSDLTCTYGAVNVMKDDYNLNLVVDKLKADKTIYKTYNNKFNLIALGGVSSPTDDTDYIKNELEERDKNRNVNQRVKGFTFNSNSEVKKETPKEKVDDFIDDDDIDSLIGADFFRFK